MTWIPLAGPLGIVIGGMLIIFYAIPLALQKGDLPAISDLQEALKREDSKKEEKEDEKEPSQEDVADNKE